MVQKAGPRPVGTQLGEKQPQGTWKRRMMGKITSGDNCSVPVISCKSRHIAKLSNFHHVTVREL